MKRYLFSGFLFLLLIGCKEEYEPTGSHFVDIPEPAADVTFFANNLQPGDTISGWGTISINFSKYLRGKEQLEFYYQLDGLPAKYSIFSGTAVNIDTRTMADGIHQMKVSLVTRTNSGNLADKLGAEAFLFTAVWHIQVKNTVTGLVDSLRYRVVNGYLELYWDPYRGEGFEEYSLKEFVPGFPEKQSFSTTSRTQTGYRYPYFSSDLNSEFLVQLRAKNQTFSTQRLKVAINNSFQLLTPVLNADNTMKLTWTRPVIRGGITGWEVNYLDNSGLSFPFSDTSGILQVIPFATIRSIAVNVKPGNRLSNTVNISAGSNVLNEFNPISVDHTNNVFYLYSGQNFSVGKYSFPDMNRLGGVSGVQLPFISHDNHYLFTLAGTSISGTNYRKEINIRRTSDFVKIATINLETDFPGEKYFVKEVVANGSTLLFNVVRDDGNPAKPDKPLFRLMRYDLTTGNNLAVYGPVTGMIGVSESGDEVLTSSGKVYSLKTGSAVLTTTLLSAKGNPPSKMKIMQGGKRFAGVFDSNTLREYAFDETLSLLKTFTVTNALAQFNYREILDFERHSDQQSVGFRNSQYFMILDDQTGAIKGIFYLGAPTYLFNDYLMSETGVSFKWK